MGNNAMIRPLRPLILLALACLACGGAEAAPTLRPASIVEGAVIRLGDLFADAGGAASDILAPAPPPGAHTIFDAAWLAAAAREHQLDWQPSSRLDQASVTRATRAVAAETIIARLIEEIGMRESVAGAELQLDNPALRLLVAAEAPNSIAIDGLAIEPRSGRFSAFIAAPAGSTEAERQHVTGRLVRMIDLPVLSHAMAPGDTIAADDIETMRVRAERLGADAMLDRHGLLGKTPRHSLRPHEPLRAGDVQAPILVHKGDLVTIVLETPALRLTAQGKALEDGAMGATLHIANTKSSRVIDARVTGPSTAAVETPPLLAAR
jgi:flagellar basal body P-ring formation protein FlgA